MANRHICLAGIMGVMEINPLSTVLQGKTVETLNAVGGNPSPQVSRTPEVAWPSVEGDAKRHQLVPHTAVA